MSSSHIVWTSSTTAFTNRARVPSSLGPDPPVGASSAPPRSGAPGMPNPPPEHSWNANTTTTTRMTAPTPAPSGIGIPPRPRPPNPAGGACPRRSITPPGRRRSLRHLIPASFLPVARAARCRRSERSGPTHGLPPVRGEHGFIPTVGGPPPRVHLRWTWEVDHETGQRTGRDGGGARCRSADRGEGRQPPPRHRHRHDPRLRPHWSDRGSARPDAGAGPRPDRPAGHAPARRGRCGRGWLARRRLLQGDGGGRLARLHRRGGRVGAARARRLTAPGLEIAGPGIGPRDHRDAASDGSREDPDVPGDRRERGPLATAVP